MNIQQLKYVLAVYQQGSINKAAHALFISQPALSMSIKDLEEELGFTIFERTKKGVVPTPAGSAFIYTIHDVIQNLDSIKAQYISDGSFRTNLVLRLATSRYSFMPDAMAEYYLSNLRKSRQYSISASEMDCSGTIQAVISHAADLGVIHTNSRIDAAIKSQLAEKRIRFVPLFESGPHAVFAKGHHLEDFSLITKDMLAEYPQIRTSSNDMDYYNANASFSFMDYNNSNRNFFMSSLSLIYGLLERSEAVYLVVSTKGIEKYHPNVCSRPLDDPLRYYFYAILPEDNPTKPAEDFVEILQACCKE